MNSDLVFREEEAPPPVGGAAGGWKILIVDGDPDVHNAIEGALAGARLEGRTLVCLHADSASQALERLAEHDDVAVLLLDVAMQSQDASLALVSMIRKQLGRHDLRIILCTGQPGRAPEFAAVRDYDIDDCRAQIELTRDRLLAMLTMAIRAWARMRLLHRQRAALEAVAEATPRLLASQNVGDFSAVLIELLAVLAGVPARGFACLQAADGGRVESRRGGARPVWVAGLPRLSQATSANWCCAHWMRARPASAMRQSHCSWRAARNPAS